MATTHTSEFLRSGKTLQNLYQRYDIQYFVNQALGVVVFNYRPLSPKSSPIVRECRGLILELDTWDVVCKPINAFFEPSESGYKAVADQFDWSSAKAMSKIDGALVCLYHYKGAWHCANRFSADCSSVVHSPNGSNRSVTWRQLVEETLVSKGTNWTEFTNKLNQDTSYVFELVTPDNRVVVLYQESHLYLVAAVNRTTLKEVDIFNMKFHGEVAPYKKARSLAEIYALIEEQPDAYKNEGYVVVDKNFNRLKIRNPKYSDAMRIYSVDDELSALRELRMLDVEGFTVITESTEPSGGGGGGGGGSGGSETINLTDISVKSYAGAMSVPPTLRNVLNRVLYLARFISEGYENAVASGVPVEETEYYPVWPKAFEGLKEGLSVSDVMDASSDHELMGALRKYEMEFAGKVSID